jgi:3-mercaptopyruvate sulfurtransferase SseA
LSPEDEIIRASEIGQYAYCARAWWYARVKGHQPENVAELQRGVREHRHHGQRVEGYHLLRRVGLALLVLAGLALAAWLLLSIGG